MKKVKKIVLNKETLERLTNREVSLVAGGMGPVSTVQVPTPQGLTPKCQVSPIAGDDDNVMMVTCWC